MANMQHVTLLVDDGEASWNMWLIAEPTIRMDLSEADLSKVDLWQANLSDANAAAPRYIVLPGPFGAPCPIGSSAPGAEDLEWTALRALAQRYGWTVY